MERAGSQALSVFANTLSARVLRAYAGGPVSTGQLEEILAWAPKSSLRAAQRRLCDLGALVEARPARGSHPATFELTTAGHELLGLADSLERWLKGGPAGPLPLDHPASQGIVRALSAAWESTVVRTLAEQPRTLAQLDGCISGVAYPSLKRRLDKLCSTGLVAQGAENGYEVSEWLRGAAQPLTLAVRWERRHDAGADPVTAIEVEAAFFLALPLVELPGRPSSGACTLSVLLSPSVGGPARDVASVSLEVSKGTIVVSAVETAGEPETWVLGDVDSWFAALVEGDASGLRVRGAKPKLGERTVAGLHRALFSG